MLDTLEYANELKAAGVPEKQAEVQAKALARVAEDNLAPKRDLKEAELSLRAESNQLRAEMNGKFTLLYWMIGFNLALSAAILMKLVL